MKTLIILLPSIESGGIEKNLYRFANKTIQENINKTF